MSSDALELLEKPEWMKEAACKTAPKNLFFLEELTFDIFTLYFLQSEKAFKRMRKSDIEEAKAHIEEEVVKQYCANCPVREQCSHAGKYERFGLWGGENLEQRFNKMGEQEKWDFVEIQKTR